MTGEMGATKDEPLTAEEEEHGLNKEPERSIGHSLRRAAGLPDEKNPFVKRSDEAHSPHFLRLMVVLIVESRHGPPWPNPRAVGAELEAIRSDLKRLKNRIASIGENTRIRINVGGGPGLKDIEAALLSAESSDDFDRLFSAFRPLEAVPREQRTVPAALSAMEQLEAAISEVIKQTIEEGARLPRTGRIPNYAARDVAFLVALYLYDVTGSIPALWTGENPSGPFAHALLEIFKIMGIKANIQRPGEWALSKLTAKLSEYFEF